MSSFRITRLLIAPILTLTFSVGIASTGRAQLLKSRKTAPAPEIRDVTQWVNSEPLSMKKLGLARRPHDIS